MNTNMICIINRLPLGPPRKCCQHMHKSHKGYCLVIHYSFGKIGTELGP